MREMGKKIDRYSLFLLLMLTLPATIMVVVLFLWPDVFWIAEIPYTAIGIIGSFAAILLAVFIIARYGKQPKIMYISAGLMAIGIIDGFRAISPPGSNEFVWLHSFAGIFGGLFFVYYVITKIIRLPDPLIKTSTRGIGWLLGSVATAALLLGVLTIAFSDMLPVIMQDSHPTPVAWAINALPMLLFLFAGISLFRQYRKTGDPELFLFTAILIFLFQASEVLYLATWWGVIWWLWQGLRLVVYLTVLSYILIKYIHTSDSLVLEVNERKKAEKALRKADMDWRNSFNSLDDSMFIVDKDYNIENTNNSGLVLLNKSREEVLGSKCYQIIHEKDMMCDYCPFQQTLRSRRVESVERHVAAFQKHFALKSAPIFDEYGKIIKFVYFMSDITKRVEAKERERLLQQELNLTSRLASIGEVAAGIAHEINNPLTGVIAFAQMLKRMDVPEDIKEAVEVMDDGANRVAGIVEKLLTFARRNRPDKEYVDINSIISNILDMRSYEMRINNIEVTTQLVSFLPRTMANVGQLQQVFLNVILNAEQAMAGAHGRGKLYVKTECVDSSIRVSIIDDGPGIAGENIDKLFNPFFTTKEASGGTGLGLSVSYGIINEHGGKIYAKSTLGESTTFIIELPIVAEIGRPKITEPSKQYSQKQTKAKIMVVDDEPTICQAIDRLLTKAGHQVETFSSAQTALLKLKTVKYDLILLDIKMPGMNGIEFYKRIKKIDPSVQQRVLCITGDIISIENKVFLDTAGIPCVTKPFGVDELMGQVNLVLGGQSSDAQIAYSYC